MYEIEILVKLGDGNVMKDYESDTNPYKALLKAMNMAQSVPLVLKLILIQILPKSLIQFAIYEHD